MKRFFKKILAIFKSVGDLSASRIEAYGQCPLKYKFKFLSARKTRISSPYLSFAESIRNSLAEIHKKDIHELKQDKVVEILKKNWARKGFSSLQEEETFWNTGIRILADYVEKNRYFRNRVLGYNERISGNFAGYNFFTTYSQVSRTPEGKIEVVSFKTSKRLQREDVARSDLKNVINWYLAKRRWGKKFGGYFVYNLYNGVKLKVEPTEKDVSDCKKVVKDVVKKIKLGEFEPEQGPLCSWCEYTDVCPARRGLADPRIYKRVLESGRLPISYSKISLYKNCPRNFKRVYIDKITTRPRYFFSIGLTIHKTMEDFYTYDGWGKPSLKWLLKRYRENWVPRGYESPQQEEKYFNDGLKWLQNYYHKYGNPKLWRRAWKVEPYFEVELSGPRIGAGHIVVGFIDRLEENPDGTYTIYDYKTDPIMRTQEDVDKDLQLTMYYWVCEKFWNIKIRDLGLIFFKFNEIIRTTRNEDDIAEMLDFLDRAGAEVIEKTQAIQGMSKEEADKLFPPKINKYCGGCDFLDECPLKEEILKMDPTKVMNLSEDLRVNESELGPDEEIVLFEE